VNIIELYNEKRERVWIAKTHQLDFQIKPLKLRDRVLGYYIEHNKVDNALAKLAFEDITFKREYDHLGGTNNKATLKALLKMYDVDIDTNKVGTYRFLVFPTYDDANNLLIAMKNITLTKGWIDFKSIFGSYLGYNGDPNVDY
jgi:hypothetical protein